MAFLTLFPSPLNPCPFNHLCPSSSHKDLVCHSNSIYHYGTRIPNPSAQLPWGYKPHSPRAPTPFPHPLPSPPHRSCPRLGLCTGVPGGKQQAGNHCPLVALLSQPRAHTARDLANESIPPSHQTHPQNTVRAAETALLYCHHCWDFRRDQPVHTSDTQLRSRGTSWLPEEKLPACLNPPLKRCELFSCVIIH